MRCRTCEYPLWNIPARQCPECGGPFLPSEYQFVPNTVEFCCPHCQQSYYGTTDKGHLFPPQFACVKCARPVSMDEMVLRPAPGFEESVTQPDHNPWIERPRLGRTKAWFAMIGRSLVAPARLMNATPPTSSVGQAWWFAVVTLLITMFASVVPMMLFFMVMIGLAGGGGMGGGGMGGGAAIIFVVFLVMLIAGFGLTLLLILLWGWLTHVLLRMTGPVEFPVGRTFHAICYSSGANLLTAVPCIGGYGLGMIWWIVSAILMTQRAQKVGGGRATFAVLTPPIVGFGLFIAGYAALIISVGAINATMTGMATAPPLANSYEAQAVTRGLVNFNFDKGGGRPPHAAYLIDGVAITPFELIGGDTATMLEDVPVPGGTLNDLAYKTPEERKAIQAAMAAALPPDVVAHRLGDFVFTYHGVPTDASASMLWVAVMCDDPGAMSGWPAIDPVVIGFADGTTTSVARFDFPSQLAAQNVLRDAVGLPPLPATLLDITHDAPAAAPPP
jgi:hypothetical protein